MIIQSIRKYALALACAAAFGSCGVCVAAVDARPSGSVSVVAQKLQSCDFLLNGEFKKDAKFYLCLFSASWCGPCRREMPRIAKTYAETLKGDPDIELIHFSRDRDDDKARAWAQDLDVKFPVVKPNGDNPLDLHTRGIPHLFILKADGTLVEEGHPMRLFTDEKLRALNNPATGGANAVSWNYKVVDGAISLVGPAVPEATKGELVIPDAIAGKPVCEIGPEAFSECRELTALTIPASVTNICRNSFSHCSGLKSVRVDADNRFYKCEGGLLLTKDGGALIRAFNVVGHVIIPPGVKSVGEYSFCNICPEMKSVAIPSGVTNIGAWAFANCHGLTSVMIPPKVPVLRGGTFYGTGLQSVTIPFGVKVVQGAAFARCCGLKTVSIASSVTNVEAGAFGACGELGSFHVDSKNPRYSSKNGMLCSKDGTVLVAGVNGDVMIPKGVRSIGPCAFGELSNLKTLTIPASVREISESAFRYVDRPLFSREMTDVTMLGERPDCAADAVFRQYGKLTAIHVPANAKSWAGMKTWQRIPLVFDAKIK